MGTWGAHPALRAGTAQNRSDASPSSLLWSAPWLESLHWGRRTCLEKELLAWNPGKWGQLSNELLWYLAFNLSCIFSCLCGKRDAGRKKGKGGKLKSISDYNALMVPDSKLEQKQNGRPGKTYILARSDTTMNMITARGRGRNNNQFGDRKSMI